MRHVAVPNQKYNPASQFCPTNYPPSYTAEVVRGRWRTYFTDNPPSTINI